MNNNDISLTFEIEEDQKIEIYKVLSNWMDNHEGMDDAASLSSRGYWDAINVITIKPKTKWYHYLVPNLVWNKVMISKIQKFDNVYVTGLDMIPYFHQEINSINFNFKLEYDKKEVIE